MSVGFPKPTPRMLQRAEAVRARTAAAIKARSAVWKRADGKCERCGTRVERSVDSLKAGHVHHRVFKSRGGKDDPRNLILTCAWCHAEAHGHRVRR